MYCMDWFSIPIEYVSEFFIYLWEKHEVKNYVSIPLRGDYLESSRIFHDIENQIVPFIRETEWL